MCNCKEIVLQRIKDSVESSGKYYKEGQKHKISFKNEMYSLDDLSLFIGLPVLVEWEHETQKGKVQNKKKEIQVKCTYCPFCGKAYKEVE